jgi:hydrogenase/urease accessory protein HupE
MLLRTSSALAAALLLALPATALAHGLGGEAANTSTLGFVPLGIEHMLLGWDHLAFIVGIVLFSGRFDRAVKLVSTFVVGHSTTLMIATLADVRVSPTAVDVVIALSVVTVGVLGLRGRPKDWTPVYFIVGGFGLVHGFGLATRLLDLGIPDDGLVLKVVAFNVGLEIGQIIAIAVIVGLVHGASRAVKGNDERARKVGYGALAAVGLIAAMVLSFPGSSDNEATATPVAGSGTTGGVEAPCTQVDVQPSGGFGGSHPTKQFFAPGEAGEEENFNHVIGDGYVIVRYAPGVPEQRIAELRTLAGPNNSTVVAAEDPEQEMPLRALTAFRELRCTRFDTAALTTFTEAWKADLAAGKFG